MNAAFGCRWTICPTASTACVRELGVSVETIKDHVAAVLKALGVSSRTQAVLAVGQMVQRQPNAAFTTFR